MCAITKKDVKLKKIKKPRTVYVIREIRDGKICSLFHTECIWKINELKIEERCPVEVKNLSANKLLKAGWFHSLPLYLAIKFYKEFLNMNYNNANIILFEAEIPSGAVVIDKNVVNKYCDKTVNGKKVFLSNQLILRKEINYEG